MIFESSYKYHITIFSEVSIQLNLEELFLQMRAFLSETFSRILVICRG